MLDSAILVSLVSKAAVALGLLQEACILAQVGQARSHALCRRESGSLTHLMGRWVHLKPALQVASMHFHEQVVCAIHR